MNSRLKPALTDNIMQMCRTTCVRHVPCSGLFATDHDPSELKRQKLIKMQTSRKLKIDNPCNCLFRNFVDKPYKYITMKGWAHYLKACLVFSHQVFDWLTCSFQRSRQANELQVNLGWLFFLTVKILKTVKFTN